MAVRQPAIRSSLFTEEPLAHEGVRHPPRPHTGNMCGEGVFWPLCPCQPQLSVESAEASCSSTARALATGWEYTVIFGYHAGRRWLTSFFRAMVASVKEGGSYHAVPGSMHYSSTSVPLV